jgi:hypothetical protein
MNRKHMMVARRQPRIRRRGAMTWNPRLATRAIVASIALLALLSVSGLAQAGSRDAAFVPQNWHIHDGIFTSCANPANPNDPWCQHKAIGFFWKGTGQGILDAYLPTPAAYQADPARCPNATDKAFLPSAANDQGVVLRAGDCFTSSLVIHLRTVPSGTGGPVGWSGPIFTTEQACLDAAVCPPQSWETWYLVASR